MIPRIIYLILQKCLLLEISAQKDSNGVTSNDYPMNIKNI